MTAIDIATPSRTTSHTATRNLALDRARTFLTIVVLIHHAVIPYTYFGHTDATFWSGFDAIVLANDSYFMAMFFLLSGLFVWPSLSRRVAGRIHPRPFMAAWPALCRGRADIHSIGLLCRRAARSASRLRGILVEDYHGRPVGRAGPIWFTWVLLVFGIIAGAIYWRAPRSIDPINRLSQRGFTRPLDFFLVFLAITALVYVPARLYFGPNDWFAFGPIAVQKSRVLLYATYFAFGIGIGAAHVERGVFSAGSALPTQWRGWVGAAIIPYALLWVLIYVKRAVLGNPPDLPLWYEAAYGLAFAGFSAAMLFAVLAIFLRFKTAGSSLLDPLQHDAYGIFLVHYVFRVVDSILSVRHRPASDRQGNDRVRRHARFELGDERIVAANSGDEAGVVEFTPPAKIDAREFSIPFPHVGEGDFAKRSRVRGETYRPELTPHPAQPFGWSTLSHHAMQVHRSGRGWNAEHPRRDYPFAPI